MTQALLDINTGFAHEIFEHDRFGNVIQPDKVATVAVFIQSTLKLASGALALRTAVKVPKHAASTPGALDALAVQYLSGELPGRLASSSYWNFFELAWFTADASDGTPVTDLHPRDMAVEVSDRIAEQANAALAHIEAVRVPFEAAKTRLNELAFHYTAFGLSQYVNEGRAAIRVLEDVLEASGDSGGYRASHARSAVRDLEELARRKVESNRNYQGRLQDLQRFAFGVTFPRSWHQRPPIAR